MIFLVAVLSSAPFASACSRRSPPPCCRSSPTTSSSSRRSTSSRSPNRRSSSRSSCSSRSRRRRLAGGTRARSGAARAREPCGRRDRSSICRSGFRAPCRCRTFWKPRPCYVQKTLGARSVVMLLPEEQELSIVAAWPPLDALSAGELGAARWALEKREPAGWRTATLPNVRFQFRPLVTRARRRRRLRLRADARDRSRIAPARTTRSTSMLDQTSIAVDRALLVGGLAEDGGLSREREAALDAAGLALARSAHAARRDHRRRHDSAAIRGLADQGEPARSAESRSRRRRAAHPLRRQPARHVAHRGRRAETQGRRSSMSPTWSTPRSSARARRFRARVSRRASRAICRSRKGDPALVEQVLFNLLDNAQKYGGDGPVAIHARRRRAKSSSPSPTRGRASSPPTSNACSKNSIRAASSDGRKTGVGLGLSIAQGPDRGDGRPHLGGKPGGRGGAGTRAARPARFAKAER